MVKKHVSHGRFQQFVVIVHFGDNAYDSNSDRIEDEESSPSYPLSDYDGWMYVTTGDDVPCLAIYGPENFGIVLKPALALYWLQIIQEYYQGLQGTTIKEESE